MRHGGGGALRRYSRGHCQRPFWSFLRLLSCLPLCQLWARRAGYTNVEKTKVGKGKDLWISIHDLIRLVIMPIPRRAVYTVLDSRMTYVGKTAFD